MKYIPDNITKPTGNQDVFNRVWNHAIVRQAPLCVRGRGATRLCRYRKQGNCCLIGAVITNDIAVYADKAGALGCGGVSSLLVRYKSFAKWFEHCGEMFLQDLQQAHDGSTSENDYRLSIEPQLRHLAQRYQLQIPA